MTYFEVTKENVETIPLVNWNETCDDLFNSVLIVPTDDIHDSGYQCMQFVFCKGSEAVKRVCRGSDVLHINGIGGYGVFTHPTPKWIKPIGWAIDCTPNGFLRLFADLRHSITIGDGISSFCIYAVESKGVFGNE